MTKEGYELKKNLILDYNNDIDLTRLNIEDKVYLIPKYKAKWLGEYEAYKYELSKLEINMNILISNRIKIERHKLKVSYTDAELDAMKIKNTKDVDALEIEINDYKEIVTTLGEIRKMVAFLGNDVNNIVSYIKLTES